MRNVTPEHVVAGVLSQHRHRWQSLTCEVGDWTYDGDNDFNEHQADRIVAALRSAGFINAGYGEQMPESLAQRLTAGPVIGSIGKLT